MPILLRNLDNYMFCHVIAIMSLRKSVMKWYDRLRLNMIVKKVVYFHMHDYVLCGVIYVMDLLTGLPAHPPKVLKFVCRHYTESGSMLDLQTLVLDTKNTSAYSYACIYVFMLLLRKCCITSIWQKVYGEKFTQIACYNDQYFDMNKYVGLSDECILWVIYD